MDDQREPREDVDRWLHARIDPLPPPPGTFDLIKKRVRRRRYRQVAVSAAVAAAVAAAVVVVPQATTLLRTTPNPGGHYAADGGSAAPTAPVHEGPARSSGQTPETASATPLPSLAPVPGNFAATSATFIGAHTGWVIGQAGTPGNCSTSYCTSVARTTDAGKTWSGVPAPLTGAPDGASGVGQIRFLTANDGWAFGPQLYATTDGGQHWTEQSTSGLRVTDLETVGNRAFAVMASCTGTGADFAAGCTSFSLYSTVAGQDAWTPVTGATGLPAGGGASSASLVLTSGQGFLLAPDGSVYAGPVDGSGSWQQVSADPTGVSCPAGAAQANGQPSGAALAAASPASLVLDCNQGAGTSHTTRLFASSDGGRTWQAAGPVLSWVVTAVAAQPDGLVVLATTNGIVVLHDITAQRQGSFQYAPQTPLTGAFSWVGLTSTTQGIAIPADSSQHRIWFTFDGGQSWQPSNIAGSGS
ncbi:MAG: hypothetical protein JO016_07465 [Actinobacteria bacterium]|nr:hypothetical protein [Actinomycetota bacterium]